MSKKTTSTKAVAVSVDKVLKENAKLAEELKTALQHITEQSNEIATLHNAVGGLQNEKATLEANVASLEDVIRKDTEYHGKLKRGWDSCEAQRAGHEKDAAHFRARLAMAENELFNVKTKLFAKIHEHEAITPNDHSALTAVLPSLLFDVHGEIV